MVRYGIVGGVARYVGTYGMLEILQGTVCDNGTSVRQIFMSVVWYDTAVWWNYYMVRHVIWYVGAVNIAWWYGMF